MRSVHYKVFTPSYLPGLELSARKLQLRVVKMGYLPLSPDLNWVQLSRMAGLAPSSLSLSQTLGVKDEKLGENGRAAKTMKFGVSLILQSSRGGTSKCFF
ncbi:hypothetical protein RRG08_030420 [Elysia crispata]|uniref:Uncharacterized protein n=1 Tax=Elysia crispata TaxID=231223 RepID=A0AAE1CXY3_9GAST|nr:hypothetical protein RRG08_030420 [Elysia crispata]